MSEVWTSELLNFGAGHCLTSFYFFNPFLKSDILLMWIYIALVLSGASAQCGAVNRSGGLAVLCHSCFIHKVFFTHCCHQTSCLLCFVIP